MFISGNGDVFTLRVTDDELGLLTEGVRSVLHSSNYCLLSGAADQVDRQQLEAEVDYLGFMLQQLEAAQE